MDEKDELSRTQIVRYRNKIVTVHPLIKLLSRRKMIQFYHWLTCVKPLTMSQAMKLLPTLPNSSGKRVDAWFHMDSQRGPHMTSKKCPIPISFLKQICGVEVVNNVTFIRIPWNWFRWFKMEEYAADVYLHKIYCKHCEFRTYVSKRPNKVDIVKRKNKRKTIINQQLHQIKQLSISEIREDEAILNDYESWMEAYM